LELDYTYCSGGHLIASFYAGQLKYQWLSGLFEGVEESDLTYNLGRHEDAGDAIRHLRAAEPSLTLDDIERANTIVFAPETANEMNATLRKVWLETPLECET
jgi:hypothetical protein